MQTYQAAIIPKSAFGTPFKGDTLFGQLCWTIHNRFGNARLVELLTGYTDGQPFAVVSDAFPAGYFPRPVLPSHLFSNQQEIDRKIAKKRIWLPIDSFSHPVADWLTHCKSSKDLPGGTASERPQPHNTINRLTNTTTGPDFAPYTMNQFWYGRDKPEKNNAVIPESHLEIYLVLDESRLSGEELHLLLTDIGVLGFGRDASIGLGKFTVIDFSIFHFPHQTNTNAWLTLAPCAPQRLGWEENCCFYQPFTRFGRHGDIGVHLGNPFKTPVLLAETGAALTPIKFEKNLFTGQGLGGDGHLSKNDRLRGTVHQGYAPAVGIALCLNNALEVS